MEKRLIIAVILSILIIIVFRFLVPQPKQPQPVPQSGPLAPIEKEILPPVPFQEPELEEEEIVMETEKYILTFTNKGGSLKDVKLKEYPDPKTGTWLRLVSDAEENRALFSMESDTLTREFGKKYFNLITKEKDKITYAYSIPNKFKVVKEYNLHNYFDYIGLRLSIQNMGQDMIYKDYDILGASSIESANGAKGMGKNLAEIDSMIDGKLVRNTKVKNGTSFINGITSWTGIKERYFCIILKPQQESEGVIIRQFDKSKLASGIRSRKIPIYPGTTIEDSYVLYIGPNDPTRLREAGVGLEQIISYGVFSGITKFLLLLLRNFYKLVGNWGIAIILLTFLINIVLFPLTRKSFMSMKKLQEIQPHMEQLRKLHKDNPQRLNKEIMELYRRYNVNPFGGCLPLFLQTPIFIALYQGLIRSIELKGANFLWIKDLSNPDYVSIPFNLPIVGNQLHVLPLLMVGAMFFQQKISTKSTPVVSDEQKQQQNIMLIFFPLFFGFLFYNFPSGLVLYWLTNTILMIIEHSVMGRTRGAH